MSSHQPCSLLSPETTLQCKSLFFRRKKEILTLALKMSCVGGWMVCGAVKTYPSPVWTYPWLSNIWTTWLLMVWCAHTPTVPPWGTKQTHEIPRALAERGVSLFWAAAFRWKGEGERTDWLQPTVHLVLCEMLPQGLVYRVFPKSQHKDDWLSTGDTADLW